MPKDIGSRVPFVSKVLMVIDGVQVAWNNMVDITDMPMEVLGVLKQSTRHLCIPLHICDPVP